MTLVRWLRSALAPRPASRTRPPARRLAVELLEDRLTPSTGGALDPTFGSGGQVINSFSNHYDVANAVTTQSDGKIVIAGVSITSGPKTGNDILVARYNADGSLDASFGTGGRTVTNFNKGSAGASAVALQPQVSGPSKILAAGGINGVFGVARYNANGSLDTTFGTRGNVTTDFGGNQGAQSMVVDGAGRILVAGASNGTVVLARYTANGALDTTFGNSGKVVTNIKEGGYGASAALQADGKIIVAETTLDPATSTDEFVVARFNPNGTADPTFGPGGVVTTHPGNDDSFSGLAVQADGRIVVAGFESGLDPDGVDRQGEYLLRYNPDGTLDGGFGSGGVEYLVNPSGWFGDGPGGVAVQQNGQIVAGGMFGEEPSGQNHFVALRVSSSGALDTGYGAGGWASTQFGSGTDLRGMALQPDGRVVLAGYARPSGTTYPTDVALARFLPSAPQVGSFTASPNPVTSGSSTTLTASNITDANPGASVTQVTFYYLDGSGTEQVLGYGTSDGLGDWALTYTVGLAPGTYTLYAQAQDSYGVFGDPLALTLTVQ